MYSKNTLLPSNWSNPGGRAADALQEWTEGNTPIERGNKMSSRELETVSRVYPVKLRQVLGASASKADYKLSWGAFKFTQNRQETTSISVGDESIYKDKIRSTSDS